MFAVARANALEERDTARRCAVRRPQDAAPGGPGRAQQALELERRDHIGIAPQAVFLAEFGAVRLVTGRQHHGAHPNGARLRCFAVIDGAGLALVGAAQTLRTHPAGQAAPRLLPGLLFGVARLYLAKTAQPLGDGQLRERGPRLAHDLAAPQPPIDLGLLDMGHRQAGHSQRRHRFAAQVSMDGLSGGMARGDRLNRERRARDRVASGEHSRVAAPVRRDR